MTVRLMSFNNRIGAIFANLPAKGSLFKSNYPTTVSFCRTSYLQSDPNPVKVLVTGAAGQIGYSLLPRLSRGDVFGPHKPVILKMLDLPIAEQVMHGVRMELEDCAFKPLKEVQVYTDPLKAFSDNDVIVMLANSMELKANMTRAHLLQENLRVYQETARVLKATSNKNVKILMIANPANTNALLLIESVKGIVDPHSLTSLSRLDHNRSKAMLAAKLGVPVDHIRKVIVWGNHSNTMVPDIRFAEVLKKGTWIKVSDVLKDQSWEKNTFLPEIRQRAFNVIKARGKSSALSAASAGIDHLRDWLVGTESGDWATIGLYTGSAYKSIPEGLVYAQPCTCKDGVITIVEGLPIDQKTQKMLDESTKELNEEKESVLRK